MNRYRAKIDISKNIEVYFDVPLFTGDSGNSVELSFFMRGEPYNMTGVTVSAKRADGQTVFDMGSISGNTVQYTIANNMHNTPGNLDVQISLSDSAGVFLTSGFLHFSVEKGYAEDSGIEADDRYPVFNSFSEELNQKVDCYDPEMYGNANISGDLYVMQGAVIDNVDAWNRPALEVNHYPMPGEEQPCARFKSGNVEIANLDHTGQLWKGDKKYVTEDEISTTETQRYANALVSDTEESETIVLSDIQPDTHMNTFTIYGVSRQDGTPTPDTPVEVVSAEDFDTVCENSDGSTIYTAHITGAMRGIPDGTSGWTFRDYIETDGTSVWEVQECGYAVLTGTENWSVSGNKVDGGTVFYTKFPDQDSTALMKRMLSNRFVDKGSRYDRMWQTNATFFVISNADIGITAEDTDAIKVQKYTAWLSENNVTVLYPLASPIRTDITGTEAGQAILSLLQTKNIVSVRTESLETNAINPLYQANYNQDINKVINELKQIIVSLGGVI